MVSKKFHPFTYEGCLVATQGCDDFLSSQPEVSDARIPARSVKYGLIHNFAVPYGPLQKIVKKSKKRC